MKCTNKCLALLTALAVCFGATGCSDEAIAFSYNPDYKVSAFRISGDTGFETADAFASGLCVVNGDINTDNSAVDMTDATSAGLFDLNSRTVLYAKNIHERLAPASLTKLMTAVVALKYGNPNDVITVSSNMGNLESGAVVCGLAEGDQLTLNQALHALLIKSANDAAVAIAEHIGGSVEGFADMMNEEAQAIGATKRQRKNAFRQKYQSIPGGQCRGAGQGYGNRRQDRHHKCCRKLSDFTCTRHLREPLYCGDFKVGGARDSVYRDECPAEAGDFLIGWRGVFQPLHRSSGKL